MTATVDSEARSIIRSGLKPYKIPEQYEQIALAFIDGLRASSAMQYSTDDSPDGKNKTGSSELTEFFG